MRTRRGLLLAGIFPPGIRDRWGDDLAISIATGGVRTWPNCMIEAARLWLTPQDWPEAFRGQTSRVLATVLFSTTAVLAILARVASATNPGPAPLSPALQQTLAGCLVLGAMALTTPIPRPGSTHHIVSSAIRILSAPGMVLVAIYALAQTRLVAHQGQLEHGLLVTVYWLALAFAALRAATFAGRMIRTLRARSTRSLAAALALLASASLLAGLRSIFALAVESDAALAGLCAVAFVTVAAALATLSVRLTNPH